MKRLSLIAFCLTLVLSTMAAGKKESVDPKYMAADAVPVVDGQVTFTRCIETGLSDKEAFDILLAWAGGRFVQPMVISGKLLKADADKLSFSANASEWLVFKQTALVTDMSRINYSVAIQVEDGKCLLTVSSISYLYEEERDGMEFTAEEWITDAECYNRDHTKFLSATGKFRIKTIDLVDQLAEQIAKAMEVAK